MTATTDEADVSTDDATITADGASLSSSVPGPVPVVLNSRGELVWFDAYGPHRDGGTF